MASSGAAVIVELFGQPKGLSRRRTVLNTDAFEKGTIMQLFDGNIASGAAANVFDCACAGISSAEKVTNDGSTTLGCWTQGVFDVNLSDACVIGAPLSMSGLGRVSASPSVASGAKIIGYAEEAGSDGEVIRMRLDL